MLTPDSKILVTLRPTLSRPTWHLRIQDQFTLSIRLPSEHVSSVLWSCNPVTVIMQSIQGNHLFGVLRCGMSVPYLIYVLSSPLTGNRTQYFSYCLASPGPFCDWVRTFYNLIVTCSSVPFVFVLYLTKNTTQWNQNQWCRSRGCKRIPKSFNLSNSGKISEN